MRPRSFALIALLCAAVPSVAIADPLEIQVLTGSPDGFLVTSTLVHGKKDAVLIDAQFSLADAHRVVAAILDAKVNLTTIYITHFHPDHYFGLVVLKQAFPKARLVALPATVADVKKTWKAKVDQWRPIYGARVPTQPVRPVALKGNTIALEGETLEIVGPVQGDAETSSYVWIPSLKAVIAGDIVFDGVHPWTAETTPTSRKAWIATLDDIARRKPTTVVPGHQAASARQKPDNVDFTRRYLQEFDRALAASATSAELQTKVKTRFPKLALDIILQIGADAALASK